MSRTGIAWTVEEDEELIEGVMKFGTQWTKIARGVLGRTS